MRLVSVPDEMIERAGSLSQQDLGRDVAAVNRNPETRQKSIASVNQRRLMHACLQLMLLAEEQVDREWTECCDEAIHDVASIRAKFERLWPYFDERRRRLWAAAETMVLGRGEITAVANAAGLQRATIRVGARNSSRVAPGAIRLAAAPGPLGYRRPDRQTRQCRRIKESYEDGCGASANVGATGRRHHGALRSQLAPG